MTTLMPRGGNDRIYTPDDLAAKVVHAFSSEISGRVLEPCAGGGAFVRALQRLGHDPIALEIDRGTDFFEYREPVDWIVTNPPWSKSRKFLAHSYTLAPNILVLMNLIHLFCLRCRMREMLDAGFGPRRIVLYDNPPKPWPQSGFQLGAIHIQRGYTGGTEWRRG